jgi:hypothetical protein
MSIPIFNAKDRPLNENTGTLPSVSDAMLDYFQPMTFTEVTKKKANFNVVEVATNVCFRGVWQPLTDRKLQMKPEGQRSWKWFWVHADPSLQLNTDDVITYLGVQYRVMADKDYSLYGYMEYHLVNDYTGSGPTQ